MKIFQSVIGLLVAASALTAQQYTISTYAGIPFDRGWFNDGSPANTVPLDFPLSVAVDPKGNLYINDFQGWIIRQVNTSGIINTIAGDGTPGYSGDGGAATSAEVLDVHGMAADGNGNVYLADTATSRVRQVNSAGNINTYAGNGTRGYTGDGGAATSAELYLPVGVAVDSAGNLYITDYGNYTVRKVVASSGNISTIAGTGVYGSSGDGGPATQAALGFPYGIAVDAAGNVYFSDTANQNIRKITTDGIIHTVATGVTAQAIAVDAAGNIYYPNSIDSTIRMITPAGTQTIVAGIPNSPGYSGDGGPATFAQLTTPYGIAIDSLGNLYVADTGNEIVRLMTPTSLTVTGVTNAASGISAVAPGSYLAPGEIITIYGVGLGPSQLTPAMPDAYGNYGIQAAGTSVIIGPPGFNYAAPILYTSATQVGAIVPYEVGLGTDVQLTVTYNGQTTPPAGLTIAPAQPGLFTANGSGTGQAAAVNPDGSLNSMSNPAPLGSIITLYGTGEGRTYPNGVDGQANTPGNLPIPALGVTVSIGGQDSGVAYVGGSAGSVAGLLQINVVIPTSLAQTLNFSAGPVAVPVVVDVGGFYTQTGVTIAVSSN